ncbi:non-ribosomal peptide synthetase [Fusarium pseudocircinatum]|uniref:Non-ribosomal peptide synthetase n=1 Tax=Fusarium pseudocircinatum TaxID=56676 RepID=A0A8H5PJW9_9HYPO|nr:non-ribosomal peptide synthetase [Fusarium pseudocircinatum]
MAHTDAMQDILHLELANALHISTEELNLDQSFLVQGGDSLSAVQFLSKCRLRGIHIDIVDTVQCKTLAELVERIISKHESNPHNLDRVGNSDTSTSSSSSDDAASATGSDSTDTVPDARLKQLAQDPARQIESIGPCSSMQNRILISQAVNPAAYQCRFILRIRSSVPDSLTASHIANAWPRIVARHSSLRTTFLESETRQSTFDQVVWTEVNPKVTILQDETQVKADGMLNSFESGSVPHHMYIYAASSSELMLRLEVSHAVIDGRSADVLLYDLCAAYENQLPDTRAMPYTDFVRMEEESFQDVERIADYWQNYLRDAEETYLASSNKPKAGLHTLQDRVDIPADEARLFCDAYGVTLVSVCQVAWSIVLRLFAMKDDVTFSYVNSGRQTDLPGIDGAIGLFISSLLLKVSFKDDPTVLDMLKTVTDDMFRGMAHDKVPLMAKGAKLPTSHKWGNSILSFRKEWKPKSAGHKELEMSFLRGVSPTDYDHSINVEIGEGGIAVDYDIWTSTTSQADAAKMLNCFLEAIRFIIAKPSAKVNSFDGISSKDAQHLRDVNGEGRKPIASCIHTLVQEVTDRQPDAMAVYAWDGVMTYRELDLAASSLAEHLMMMDIGPEVMVGICMDKSRWATVSMLAVLKSGGIVLPLGADQPLSRLHTILSDTKAPIILVDNAQLNRLKDLGPQQLIEVNEALFQTLPSASRSACTTVSTDNAAWVVYTSGSTGTPKGVVLQHSALCTSITSHGIAFGVKGARVLQFASHTFDVTIQEVFTTLCMGGCVCVPSEDDRVNHLQAFISSAKVDFLSLTSTVAGLLDPSQLPLIKTVILMGEPVKPAVLDLWKDQASVLESYAPSECSIYATVSPQPMKHISQVSVLGIPLASCFWVVDPKNYNRLCPIGAPGELLIEGPLLARGYLNDEVKTNKSFILDPEFVGKMMMGLIRRWGDRIRKSRFGDRELRLTNPSSIQAVVLYVHGQLVAAFSLPSDGAAYSGAALDGENAVDKPAAMLVASEVQLYLSQYVPDYMIPRLWIPMASLPINSSGKADRRRISEWIKHLDLSSYSDLEHQVEDGLQVTSTERQLREIWSSVLNKPINHISYRRSFLSLGGDSITAMQVVSACRKQGLIVPVRQILQSPAIFELALRVKEASDKLGDEQLPIEIPDEPFDLSPAQKMFFQDIAPSGLRADGPHRFNQSVCFRVPQNVAANTVARAIEAIVTKHAMLRARFQTDQDSQGWQQRVEKQIMGSYRFQTHKVVDDTSTEDIIRHSQGSLDLEYGPVFAVDVFEMEDAQLVNLTAHHLVIDLMSWRILAADLEHFLRFETLQPSLSLPFPTWSKALMNQAKHVAAPEESDVGSWSYWSLEPGPFVREDQVVEKLAIDADTSAQLLGPANESLQTGVTDILLAALHQSFAQVFTDRSIPTIHVEGHGRDAGGDVSETVGWFTTVTLLKVTNTNPGFITTLQQVKDFRKLNADTTALDFAAKYKSPTSPQNLIEILFNYHGQFQQLDRADGLLSIHKLHSSETSIGDKVRQQAAITIEVSVESGRVCISVGFSRRTPKGDDVRRWLQRYGEVINSVVSELMSTERTATASDYPLSRLSSNDLVALKKHILEPTSLGWDAVEDVLPCSSTQQGIFISQLKSPTTYRLRQTCRVTPTASQGVDVERLGDAWRQVVSNHSIMRTIFTMIPFNDRFYQVVLKSVEPDIRFITCSSEEDVRECIASHALMEDHLGRPSHRFLVISTEDGHVYGHFEISHALVDASSVQLLVNTLLQAYEGARNISGSDYGTYISFLEQGSEEDDLRYWEKRLATVEPCQLQLGEDLTTSEEDAGHSVSTAMQDMSTLQKLCQSNDITPANVLQLAWALVLSSRTQLDEVCFGYLSSGRDIPIDGADTLVGPMINMIVCNIALDYSQSCVDAMRDIQDRFLDSFEHQRVSLATIQHSLSSSQQSLFNTTVSYVRAPNLSGAARGIQSIRLERIAADESTEYDFNLSMLETESGIDIALQYLPGAASTKTAQRLLNHLKHVVQVLSTSETTSLLGDLDLVPAEDKQLITAINREVPKSLDSCVHLLVQEMTNRQPNALAFHAWDGSMTYRDLDLAASTLAKHLVTNLNVGPEVMVGVCMDKSIWAAMSMLAVLKAGGVVLPLGVQQPLSRLQTILNDTQASVILVDAKQKARLAGVDSELIEVNHQFMDGLVPAEFGFSNPAVQPDNTAWIVYTSGSTGVPKGVVLQHYALCTSMRSHGAAFSLIPSSRVLQFAAYTFDVTIQETFTTLYFGGCVCIPSEEERLNNLEGCIVSMDVNFVSLTSTVAGLLSPSKMPLVKTLILIGEPVKPSVLDLWMPQAACLDAYGPSECSIQSAISPEPMTDRRQAMILGTPLESCRFWVVDYRDYNKLCPVGVPGELLIEGPHLAREYLNDATKTAKSFITDPAFLSDIGLESTGRRMYRAGDLVRQNDDGTYSNLGRRDQQIKIRGKRVEVGEIEYHISRHSSGIRACVVFTTRGSSDGQLVTAFSVPHDDKAPHDETAYNGIAGRDGIDTTAALLLASEIQMHLSQHIPDYMIPRLWIPMTTLPINSSGKADRRAVTEWINSLSPTELASYSELESAAEEANLNVTPTEQRLREIWSSVLNVPNVSYRRSFMSLGGDSITAMQVVSACREIGLVVTVRDILQSPAISDLATRVKVSDGEVFSAEIPDGPFELSPAQKMFFEDIAPAGLNSEGSYRFNQSVCFRLQSEGISEGAVAKAIEAVVTKHAMLRSRFISQEHRYQQWIEKHVPGSYRFKSHIADDDTAVQAIMLQSQSTLDLEHGPVFAAEFIQTPDRQLLFLTAHHLAIDLMSWRVIAKDLEQILQGGSMVTSQSLPFPTWSNAVLQQAQSIDSLTEADTSASWSYWGLQPGEYITEDQAFETVQLDEQVTSQLLGPANEPLRSGVADILLAALSTSFRHTFSDRAGPSIFIEGHGRDTQALDINYDLSDTVGWFTTVTPLVTTSHEANFISTLRQVKDVRKLNSGREVLDFASQRSRPIEVLFNYHGQFQQLQRSDGLLTLDKLHQSVGQLDASVGAKVRQHAALSVEVSIDDAGKTHLVVGYPRQSPKSQAIRDWLGEYARAITQGVQELVGAEPMCTISDFPLAQLTNDDLDTLYQYCLTPGSISWANVENVLPCSPIQQGILLSQLRAPSRYRLKQTCRILPADPSSPVDISRLANAWRQVIGQHSIMRTIFTGALSHHDRFYQVVLKALEADIQIIEPCSSDEEVQRFIKHHALLHDPVGRPSHRFLIIPTVDGHVFGHFEISHALVDASSVQLLVNDLLEAYESLSPTKTSISLSRNSNYGSYVSFLEQHRHSEQEDLQYWKDFLETAEPCHLQLGQQHHDTSEMETGHAVTAHIPDISVLRDMCRNYNVTAANVAQLAWALVLASRVELNQICFGYLSSGRDIPIDGVERLVGPMINMMICYVQLDCISTTVDVIRQIQDRFFKGFDHQRASLASIQHSLQGTQQQTLFNTTVSYTRALNMDGTTENNSIKLERASADESTEYDFNLSILENDQSLDLVLQYIPGVASHEVAQRLLNQLKHVIQVLSQHTTSTLADLDLVPKEEKNAIVAKNRDVPKPVASTIHALFHDVYERRPDEMAVHAWDGIMTFRELEVAAGNLAGYLMDLGVGPEIMVGICMDKSRWAVVAMLAVLKAGGVVLPMGVQQPLPRVQTIMTDTKAPIILVDDKQLSRLAGTGPCLIKVDAALQETLKPSTKVCSTVTTDNAAWVVYTSGSTGTPKGVVLQHSALCSSIRSHGDAFGVRDGSRVLQFASHTFDVTIQEVFTTLCQGGCTCIPSEDERINHLQAFIAKAEVNFLSLTSTVAGLLDPAQLPFVKTVILMGEPVKPAVMDLWKDQAIVLESYAPSECSIYATVSPRPMRHISQVPVLGIPLASCFWVVNPKDFDRLVPIGAPGELLIEGPLLARGYLGDEEKTANSFLIDPDFTKHHGLQPGRRMYRTGDLVRQNSDGSYTTLGRRDTQIKIRGQRVEFGEIEYWVVRSAPEISQAAVMLLDGPVGQSSVLAVALEIADGGENSAVDNNLQGLSQADLLEPTIAMRESFEEVRGHLISVLPRYMVPDIFIPMSRLPLNSSGKLDRRAIDLFLKGMKPEELDIYRPNAAAKADVSTDTERQLQNLWASVLGRPANTVGAKDSFFHLGGDSITAMRLVEASRSTNMLLRVADVFEHPRLSELASILDSRLAEGHDQLSLASIPAPFSLWPEHSTERKVDLGAEIAERCGVMAEQIEDVYSCTPLQEGLLIATARQPSAYVSRRIFSLSDEINVARLQAAWQKMAEAAPVLRTRILLGLASGSVQVVVNEPLQWHTASSLEEYIDHDSSLSMTEGKPLMRFGLVESDGERLLVWTAHHSVYDGWSLTMMYRQVSNMYWHDATPLSAPYTPFIAYLGQSDASQAASYWRGQLQGNPTAFPALPSVRYQPQPRQKLVQSLDFVRQGKSEVSLSNLLRAAWALMVAKYSGSDDVVFAVTLSGRNAPVHGITEMLAPTITTVPVRVRINSSTTAGEFLQEVQQQATDMIPFEHTGLQRIAELVPDAAAALNMQHLFVVQPAADSDDASAEFPGLVHLQDMSEQFDDYALTVECSIGAKGISVESRFDDAVISAAQMQRMLQSFAHIASQLEEAEDTPEGTKISDIDTLSPQDLDRILAINSGPIPIVERCVHDLILDMVSHQPDATAISAWDGTLTYKQLKQLSGKLSDHLVSLGVRHGTSVGVCMDKSQWAAVSMLAVLRAGGIVVPLGVQLPLGRIKLIVDDAKVSVVLADQRQTERLAGLSLDMFTVDDSLRKRVIVSDVGIPDKWYTRVTEINVNQPAWIVYTSGSTGTPKGVVLTHAGISSSLDSQKKVFGLNKLSRVLQFAAHTFDAAIQEIFTTLFAGGCVCVPSEDERMSDLQHFIIERAVNFLSITPTVAELLNPSQLPNINTVVLLGEPVKPSVLDLWMDHHADIIGGYGPTECSIYAIVSATPFTDRKQANVLGTPLPSCRVWVVDPDDYNKLCPIGAPGELLIEGPQVSQGYLNDAAKTDGAFITDPGFTARYGLGNGHRMYRTGDLVQQNDDGTYTNLGRRDTQVKIHGQRIELGEIEYSVVQVSEGIRSAAAVFVKREIRSAIAVAVEVGEGQTGEGVLAPSETLRKASEEIRVKLAEVLPQYMIPDFFVPMGKLPVNSSGKLDRRAITAVLEDMDDNKLEEYRLTTGAQLVPVSTDMEKQLQQLWSQVLRRPAESIGASDNFFHLNGDSLAAIQLVAAARALNLKMTVAQIFQSPVLRDLAIHLEQATSPHQTTSHHVEGVDEETKAAIKATLPSTFNAGKILEATEFQSLVLHEHTQGRWLMHATITYNQKVDKQRVHTALQTTVAKNEILRTVFTQHAGKHYQAILNNFAVPFQEHTTSSDLSNFCKSLIQEDQKNHLELHEPPFKTWFIQGEHTDGLVVRISHAQYDGMSLPIFFQQLQAWGEADVEVEAPRQMSYYVDALRAIDAKPAIKFWGDLLEGSSMTSLPGASQTNKVVSGSYIVKTVPSPKVEGSGLTVSSYLKAAWAMVLAKATGTSDVVFAHLVSGRSLPIDDIEKVNGPCVNLIPIRVNTAQPHDTIIHQIHQQHISALPHEHLGWETIFRQCTNWDASFDQIPRFSSILQYQNLPEAQKSFGMHGAECSVDYTVVPPDVTDIWVTVEPRGGEMSIVAGYSEEVIAKEVVEGLMEDLCEVLKSIEA